MANYIEEIERLKILVTGASTDISIEGAHETEYRDLRYSLSKFPKYKSTCPKELKICSSLKEFRQEMQSKFPDYKSRRSYINELFYPLISDEDISNEVIENIVQQVNFGHLNLLPVDILNKGREMADVYLYLYCIENSLRIFIDEIKSKHQITIPKKVQETIEKLKKSEAQSKYLPLRGDNDLFYCDFIELGKIIVFNWIVFGEYFPKQNEHWLNVMVDELYKIRCLVAHNSYVSEHEINALKVYYKNITLQLNFEKFNEK
jgi:hypothetical protein